MLPKSEVVTEAISLQELIRSYLQVKQENEALKTELANLRKQNEGLVPSLQGQLAAVVADNVNLHAEIKTLRAENEAFRTEIANLRAANATLDAKLQKLLRNVGKLTWREGMRTLEI